MNDNHPDLALDIASASLLLAFHSTNALLEAGLLSPGKRRECASGLRTLHGAMQASAIPSDLLHQSMDGMRDLIGRLEEHPQAREPGTRPSRAGHDVSAAPAAGARSGRGDD